MKEAQLHIARHMRAVHGITPAAELCSSWALLAACAGCSTPCNDQPLAASAPAAKAKARARAAQPRARKQPAAVSGRGRGKKQQAAAEEEQEEQGEEQEAEAEPAAGKKGGHRLLLLVACLALCCAVLCCISGCCLARCRASWSLAVASSEPLTNTHMLRLGTA
jgi:hypothetical protein